ncbi:MAG: HTH domain-containing protein [Nanoarchaeota archaeon]
MDSGKIKNSFQKVREDTSFLKLELNSLKQNIGSLKQEMLNLCKVLTSLSKQIKSTPNLVPIISNPFPKIPVTSKSKETPFLPKDTIENIKEYSLNKDKKKSSSNFFNSFNISPKKTFPYQFTDTTTHIKETPTIPTHNPTHSSNYLVTSTDNGLFKPLKHQILGISTRNEGVPTDRQTNQQTDRHIQQIPIKTTNPLENASEILDSLDNLKKEIRLKFKRLTNQEIAVFSSIYQLEEEKEFVDYKSLSERLNLSESSIRDYIGKLIKKGIPVEKVKLNNKTITLSISKSLKKVVSLSTILQLREL